MILAVLGMMTSVVQAQSATPLFDWAANPGNTELTTTTVTNSTDGSLPGREITKLWFAENATDYFFRLDLAGAPTNLNPSPSDFAEAYAIDIQYASGGGNHSESNYIAEGLSNITYILMTHAAESQPGLFTMDHLHTYDYYAPGGLDTAFLIAGEGTPVVAGANVYRPFGSTEMDWEVPINVLGPGPFTIFGSTINSTDGDTYTVTGPVVVAAVPEPTTLALAMAGGLVLLGWCRARKSRRA
jgi:hypothetical protein